MLLQPCLVSDHFFLGNALVFSHPLQEGTDIPQIFVNGGDAFFPIRQISPVLLQCLFSDFCHFHQSPSVRFYPGLPVHIMVYRMVDSYPFSSNNEFACGLFAHEQCSKQNNLYTP